MCTIFLLVQPMYTVQGNLLVSFSILGSVFVAFMETIFYLFSFISLSIRLYPHLLPCNEKIAKTHENCQIHLTLIRCLRCELNTIDKVSKTGNNCFFYGKNFYSDAFKRVSRPVGAMRTDSRFS